MRLIFLIVQNLLRNYKSASILSEVSKVYERCLYYLIYKFFEDRFSKNHCRFHKAFNTQNVLPHIEEKMLLARDIKEVFGAILTDLSKSFNRIIQDRLIAKLHAYGFDRNGLKVIHDKVWY